MGNTYSNLNPKILSGNPKIPKSNKNSFDNHVVFRDTNVHYADPRLNKKSQVYNERSNKLPNSVMFNNMMVPSMKTKKNYNYNFPMIE